MQTQLHLQTPALPGSRLQARRQRQRCSNLRIHAAIAPPPRTPEPQVPAEAAKPAPHGRVLNFSAGPAVLPVEVLESAQADLLNWKGSGMSVMEMSHRGKEFVQIIENAEADLRTLLTIPSNYKVDIVEDT